MNANSIRYRLKSDRKIYECHPMCLHADGRLEHTRQVRWGNGWANENVWLKPDEYEIIPEEDFFEFRRNTARGVLLKLMEQVESYNNEDYLVDEAIRITDKLIEKL